MKKTPRGSTFFRKIITVVFLAETVAFGASYYYYINLNRSQGKWMYWHCNIGISDDII